MRGHIWPRAYLVYYSKIDTNDFRVNFIRMDKQLEHSYKFQSDVYDCETGVNRWSARKTATIACYGDGEKYLHALLDSFIRGLRQGLKLELHINASPTECHVPDLFSSSDYVR